MSCSFKSSKSDYPYITPDEELHFKLIEDFKCVSKNARNLLQKVIDEDAQKNKQLEKYKNKIRGPNWYEELTERQVAAANLLFTALRKETLDYQLKRTKHVLWGISINPLPNKNQLTKAIKFAKNSDLAFLWYLYHKVYHSFHETCTQRKYSLNERVILSCICHLDMLVTLRELDKILPKPNMSKIIKTDKRFNKKKVKYSHILPPRPVPPLSIYEMYKDPFYVIENESNRWFSRESLVFSTSHCIVKKILTEEISKIGTNTSSPDEKILCGKHHKESSKFYQLMKYLMDENENIDFKENSHRHLSISDREIEYGMFLEFQKWEDEFKQNVENADTDIIMKTLLNQILNNSFNQRYIHLCNKCEDLSTSNDGNTLSEYEKDDDEDMIIYSKTSYNPLIIKYFQRPSIDGSHPLTFDYEKIFSIDFLYDHGVVKNSINTALKLNKYLTEDNAITVCLRDMWQTKLKEWNEKRQADIEERQKRVVADVGRIGKNKEKILKLLREAIDLMRKNPKFVLAALPQCHRLPILREWILQRYGVKYIDQNLIKTKYGMDGKYL
ncbi:hypothetical protein ACKWTF_006234 [Chironomus riparius]